MSNVCNDIIVILTRSFQWISTEEDCDALISEYIINAFVQVLPERIDLSGLNNRDNLSISCFEDEDIVASFNSTNTNSWCDFIREVNAINKEQAIRVKIVIEKNQIDKCVSIYYIDKFLEYIKTLSFTNFLSTINNHLFECLIFEVQDDNYEDWNTTSIAFVAKGHNKPILSHISKNEKEKRINEARLLCYCDLNKYGVIPEDLFFKEEVRDPLQRIFQTVCHLYTFSFMFDYFSVKNNMFEYKLNGFKTLSASIKTDKVDKITVDNSSCKIIYEVYQWLYLGGNYNDKMIIARNIVSLNLQEDILSVNNSTFDAILSNYKIYEKDNVKQYIQIRNKISELLIDLQTKIGDIVDNFIGDFKRNLIALISFFISVIVIQVVSKDNFIGGFTNEIILLSVTFLIISMGILFYSRWELKKKVELFQKHYEQIKNRYKELLSESELKYIFEDCDPQKKSSHVSFVDEQRKLYSWLWGGSLVLLFITFVVIYNNNNNSIIIIFFKSIVKCCIQNISQ